MTNSFRLTDLKLNAL